MDSVLVQGGPDRAALLQLIDEYQQPIGSYLVHLIGESDAALELTRETFVRAYRARVASKSEGPHDLAVRPWLYRVATRLAFVYQRRSRGQLVPTPEWELDRSERLSAAIGSGESERVQSVLCDLPVRERAVLLLCDLEHLPDHEAAAVLSIGVDRLSERLRQARTHFRRAYVLKDALASHDQNGHV